MKKTIAALVFGGLVFNSGFAAVHSVGSIPQKAEGDFLLAGEINTILKTISGIFFDDSNGNVGIGVPPTQSETRNRKKFLGKQLCATGRNG